MKCIFTEVKWQYQHWHGRRFGLCQMTIPPEPEPWTELRIFFFTADVDRDGFFSKADAAGHSKRVATRNRDHTGCFAFCAMSEPAYVTLSLYTQMQAGWYV